MSQDREELSRPGWRDFFDLLTKEHEGDNVTIELVSVDFGDQQEAEKLPLAYIEYDKDDDVIVAVGGRDSRFPVVLRHIIEHPRRIFATPAVPGAALVLDIEAADGSQTLVTVHRRPALPG